MGVRTQNSFSSKRRKYIVICSNVLYIAETRFALLSTSSLYRSLNKGTLVVKIYEDSVLTVDAKCSVVRYLVEESCRITFMGNVLSAECVAEPVERLGRRAAMPF